MKMKKYICLPCGYIYDPAIGDPDEDVEPGTAFRRFTRRLGMPRCGEDKDQFAEVEE